MFVFRWKLFLTANLTLTLIMINRGRAENYIANSANPIDLILRLPQKPTLSASHIVSLREIDKCVFFVSNQVKKKHINWIECWTTNSLETDRLTILFIKSIHKRTFWLEIFNVPS